MLPASAINAMLKAKSYKDGTLFSRIDQAAKDHLITQEMAKWAHNVRLDANEPRHADEGAPLPTPQDGRRSIDFALALAEFMFVLPSKVSRGVKETEPPKAGIKEPASHQINYETTYQIQMNTNSTHHTPDALAGRLHKPICAS